MPKYLAQDYLAEALQHRHSLLERMQVAPPHHIEFVDAYLHKGEVEDTLYTAPWLMENFCATAAHVHPSTWSGEGWEHVISESSVEESVRADLARLVERCSLREDEPESFSELSCAASITSDEGCGSDVDLLLSQEIDSAIERLGGGRCGGGGEVEREEFGEENMHAWGSMIETGCVEHLLEEPESPGHRDILLSLMPAVGDLARRLKPKLLQDPLLDASGEQYTHLKVFRSDLAPHFATSDESPQSVRDEAPTVPPFEQYAPEVLEFGDTEVDPILEIPLSSPENPLSDAAEATLPTVPSPHKDVMEEDKLGKTKEDLDMLISEAKLSLPPVTELPEFSPSARLKLGTTDFFKLNDPDMSRESVDSGIGHALLESPCLPMTSSPITTPLSKQLGRLEPFPLSPDLNDKLVLMSPATERKFLKRMWEKDKMFDSILALTLPYPDIEDKLEDAVKSSSVPAELLQLLDLKPTNMDGDLELDLPWDPLAESYKDMSLAQKKLMCLAFPADKEQKWLGYSSWKEEFRHGDSVETMEERDFPISMDPEKVHVPQHTDVPTLGLRSVVPPGYLTAHPVNQPQMQREQLQSAQSLVQRASNYASFQSNFSKTNPPHLKSSSFGQRSTASVTRNPFLSQTLGSSSSVSALDTFMMLRSGSSVGHKRRVEGGWERDGEPGRKRGNTEEGSETKDADVMETVTSPTFQDICLSGEYQSALSRIEDSSLPILQALRPYGLHAPHGLQELPPDGIKFFLKQQQKALEDNKDTEQAESILQSCQLAACLHVLGSLADALLHCSLTTGLGKFSSLSEKYEDWISGGMDSVKQELLQMQLAAREEGFVHPKLHELVKIVAQWMRECRRNRQEKAVVIVGREFPTLSGEILDFLQSIPNLKSCVFSFASDGTLNPLYLEAVEERLHHYDCLVVPPNSIASNFPWEKVALLVEYEQPKTPLFPETTLPENVKLKKYVILRSVREISASALAESGEQAASLSSVQYTVIGSENVISNTQLLQLLESKYNTLIVERDYSELKRQPRKPRMVSYADLILDQSSGILLRPLSLLATDAGLKTLVNTVTALSLQYEKCWVILFVQDDNSYPFGGCVPANLARLHASVAHYCPKQDHYEVGVLCAYSMEETAQVARRITEETHRASKVWSHWDWKRREWLAEEMNRHECFLLNFPCLNSFSAQLMLQRFTVGQLLSMDESELQQTLPWLPEKVTKLFHRMCNVSYGSDQKEEQPGWGGMPVENSGSLGLEASEYSMDNGHHGHYTHQHPVYNDLLLQSECEDGHSMIHGHEISQDNHLRYDGDTVTVSSEDEREYYNPSADSRHFHFETNSSANSTEVSNFFSIAEEQPEQGNCSYIQTTQVTGPGNDMAEYGQEVHHDLAMPGGPATLQSIPTDFTPGLAMFEEHRQSEYMYDDRGNSSNNSHCDEKLSFNFETDSHLHTTSVNPHHSWGSSFSWNQPQSASSYSATEIFGATSTARPNLLSTGRSGRTPSQKQIREMVASKFSDQSDASKLSREYYSGPISSRFMASSTAKNTPVRNPVKSLDLGFDGFKTGNPRLQLQANDRAIAESRSSGATSHQLSAQTQVSRLSGRNSGVAVSNSRFLDLKSFHSREKQMTQHSQHSRMGNTPTQPPTSTAPWLGIPCLVSKATRQKRPYIGGPTLGDCRVPSNSASPPDGEEASFYSSPNASIGSIKLSPMRKKRLMYEKVPGSADGQTRLRFNY